VTETEGGLDKVAEVLDWRRSKLFSPAERVALEYAERITYTLDADHIAGCEFLFVCVDTPTRRRTNDSLLPPRQYGLTFLLQ